MEQYKINENLTIEARSWNRGRQSWGHEARAIYNGREVASTRCTYYNRTWEAYQYQSVMLKLIDIMDQNKSIPLADRIQAYKLIKQGDQRELRGLQKIGALAMLGGIMGGNKTKAKILGAIPGIDMPEDFATLSEVEQTKRLDGAINILINYMDEKTRVFFVVDSIEDNEELFTTLEDAEAHLTSVINAGDKGRLYIAMVRNAFYEKDLKCWNYDDHSDTFKIIKIIDTKK